jgi:orotate phosphoribosyltransferase
MAYVRWSDTDKTFSNIQLRWNDRIIIEDVVTALQGGTGLYDAIQQLESTKRARFIELIVHFNRIEIYSGRKTIKEVNVTVDHVRVLAKAFNIDVMAENIHV